MGAGFAIAMRDLEIRGAGNILGIQQSGHIAAIGYELYCELLEQVVRRLKKLPPKQVANAEIDLPVKAYLPRSYIPGIREKIDLYRRLARLTTMDELNEITTEFTDRFGAIPEVVRSLLELAHLRILACEWGVVSIHVEEEYLVFGYLDRSRVDQLVRKCQGKLRIADDHSAYLPIGKLKRPGEKLLEIAKSMLRSAQTPHYTPSAL